MLPSFLTSPGAAGAAMVGSPIAMGTASLGLAFLLSMTVAWIYTMLHRDGQYSRRFLQALALAGVVSALIVLAIGDSIARGIGLVGAVTVVRFRSNLQDPRDLIFIFASLAVGVAAGAQAFLVATAGTAVLLVGTLVVTRQWFARPNGAGEDLETFDNVLSLQTSGDNESLEALSEALRRGSEGYALMRLRATGDGGQEHAYQVKVSRPDAKVALFQAIQRVPGVHRAQLVTYDESQEI